MKYIWLGIKDYCKDCWHDFWYWFWESLCRFINRRCTRCYCWQNNDGCYTKEGNLWHYIRQRKIANKVKKRKKMSKKHKPRKLPSIILWIEQFLELYVTKGKNQ